MYRRRYAEKSFDLTMLNALLARGGNPNLIVNGIPILLEALDDNREDIAWLLVRHGAKTDVFNEIPFIIYAAAYDSVNDPTHVKYLLNLLNDLPESDITFSPSVFKNDSQATAFLLKLGANANELIPKKHNMTALHIAVISGNVSLLKTLVEYGGNIQALTSKQTSLFHYVCTEEMFDALIAHYDKDALPVFIDQLNNFNYPPLMYAPHSIKYELIKHGASFNLCPDFLNDENLKNPIIFFILKLMREKFALPVDLAKTYLYLSYSYNTVIDALCDNTTLCETTVRLVTEYTGFDESFLKPEHKQDVSAPLNCPNGILSRQSLFSYFSHLEKREDEPESKRRKQIQPM